jgi:hypothetical protein
MKRLNIALQAALTLGLGLVFSGCAEISTSPRWDAAFGNSVAQINALQTLNPQGAARAESAAGVDGMAAEAAQKTYIDSFSNTKAAAPASQITIN